MSNIINFPIDEHKEFQLFKRVGGVLKEIQDLPYPDSLRVLGSAFTFAAIVDGAESNMSASEIIENMHKYIDGSVELQTEQIAAALKKRRTE